MEHKIELKIFLIEPNDKTRYKRLLVYTKDEESARRLATASINKMQVLIPGEKTKLLDPVYSDERLSKCVVVDVEVEKIYNSFKFFYNGIEHSITRDHAISLKINDDTD